MKKLKFDNDFFNKNKVLLILVFILSIFVLMFFLSLINKNNSKNKNIIESALVNKKYSIEKISIKDNFNTLNFYKYENFWGAQFIQNQNEISQINFPVEQNLINEFLADSKSIRHINVVKNFKTNVSQFEIENIYKKFGLLSDDCVEVSFISDTQTQVSKIYFGFLNESKDKIFFRTSKSLSIYSMDCNLLSYLDTDINFWAEKSLIPNSIFNNLHPRDIQNIIYNKLEHNSNFDSLNSELSFDENFLNTKNEIYEKILSLRFSKIINNEDFEVLNFNTENDKRQNDFSRLNLKIFFGNATEILLKFTPIKTKNGDCYLQDIIITPTFSLPNAEKEFIKKLNYKAVISEWTYNSMLNMLELK